MDRPIVRTFPSDDHAFAAAVAQAVATIDAGENGHRDIGSVLEAALRATYPDAHVQPMDPLGGIGNEGPVLYAYRDGALLHGSHASEA